MARDLGESLREVLTGDEEGRVCRDIPDAACRHEGRNVRLVALSNALSKSGDGLADAKLVLPALLAALGAPAALIGLLVPVREALALLPQLAISARIRRLPVRKGVWALAAVVQGLAVAGMALVALTLDGAAAGWAVLALLAVAALARSAASVSHKDVLGKTVDKQHRGTATGLAGTLAAVVLLAFGAALVQGLLAPTPATLAAVLAVAGGLWLAAGALFMGLVEEPGAVAGGVDGVRAMRGQLAPLARDGELRRFLLVRGLLVGTALAPPYLLAVAAGDGPFGALGAFLVAAALAALASDYLWGRFADLSSRQVLITAAALGAVALVAGTVLALAPVTGLRTAFLAIVLFTLLVAHQGVRLGRKTHLVDMAGREDRAAYTASSNTIIGAVLLLGGGFGLVADAAGPAAVLAIFAALALAAAAAARRLEEVQA